MRNPITQNIDGIEVPANSKISYEFLELLGEGLKGYKELNENEDSWLKFLNLNFKKIADELKKSLITPTPPDTTDPFGDNTQIAYYPFIDNALDADLKVGGDLTYNGTPTNITYSNGAVFNGSSSIVDINNIITTQNFSISFNIKFAVVTGYGSIFTQGTEQSSGLHFRLNNGNLVLYRDNVLAFSITSPGLSTTAFENFAITREVDGKYRFYRDGTLVATSTEVDNFSTSGNVRVGFASWYFNGTINNLRLFNRGLSDTEITSLINNFGG